jgi:hypothetical protein
VGRQRNAFHATHYGRLTRRSERTWLHALHALVGCSATLVRLVTPGLPMDLTGKVASRDGDAVDSQSGTSPAMPTATGCTESPASSVSTVARSEPSVVTCLQDWLVCWDDFGQCVDEVRRSQEIASIPPAVLKDLLPGAEHICDLPAGPPTTP